MIRWAKRIIRRVFVGRKLRSLSRALDALDDLRFELSKLEKQRKGLERLADRFENRRAAVMDQLEGVERKTRNYESTIDALRSELKVLGEVELAGLVEANRVLIERWRAATSIEVMRQVAARGDRNEGSG